MRQLLAFAACASLAGCTSVPSNREAYHLIPGQVPLDWRGPDGNTEIFDAPEGLVVVDTGRHPAHAQAIIDYAKARGRPIAAILNTHWHLDHTTGNWDLRRAYPEAKVYATGAIDGALRGFLNNSKAEAEKRIADPNTPDDQRAQMVRGRYVVDHAEWLRPTVPVAKSATMTIAGRKFDIHVSPFAATEADLWLYDRNSRTAVVGDLVVDIVPFMDTACIDGWVSALDEIERTPFETLVPGHGQPMGRAQFLRWKSAFIRFIECGTTDHTARQCGERWATDAAEFISPDHRQYAVSAAAYYVENRMQVSQDEFARYCRAL